MPYGLSDGASVDRKATTVHRYSCGFYRRATNKSGLYLDIEAARTAGRELPHEPCIMICRECNPHHGTDYEGWRCLCYPEG